MVINYLDRSGLAIANVAAGTVSKIATTAMGGHLFALSYASAQLARHGFSKLSTSLSRS